MNNTAGNSFFIDTAVELEINNDCEEEYPIFLSPTVNQRTKGDLSFNIRETLSVSGAGSDNSSNKPKGI